MPLVNVRNITPEVKLGLWKIEETPEELYTKYPFLTKYQKKLDEKYSFDGRKLEFLVIRLLLLGMTNDEHLVIEHNKDGKPIVQDWHISISHTKGWAVLMLSRNHEVGVDIEYYSDRVSKIVSKFVRKDEDAQDVDSQLVIWSAKEAVYKYFSKDDLKYEEMKVFKINDSNCAVINFKRMESVPVTYELNKDYVLTYVYSK